MTPLSLKNMPRIWGYANNNNNNNNNNKRCIPKEGMPHAQACQKKERIERCIPKEGMPHTQACKKKDMRKIAPYPKQKKKRDGAYKRVHTPSTKNIHTLAHLDQGL